MADDEQWWHQAKCFGSPTNLFYPPRDRRVYRGVANEAKALCWGTGENDPPCPVRMDCLLDALGKEDPHGIWGGLSHRERRHLKRKYDGAHQTTTFHIWVTENYGSGKAQGGPEQVPRCDEGPEQAYRAS
jgi:WhiB family redox-sensing transcriptional regulator